MRLVLIPLLLAGCGIQPYQMQTMPIAQVCYWAYHGGPQTSGNARADLARRGYSCTQQDIALGHQQAQSQQAQSAADLATAGALLGQSRPAPAPPTSCRSVFVGNVMQTVCN